MVLLKRYTHQFILSSEILFLIANMCAISSAYEISAESKKIVDAALEPGVGVFDGKPDEIIPPGSIPLDAIDYLIGLLFSEDRNMNRAFIVLMIENIYESHPEKLQPYGLDDLLIRFVESKENKEQYDLSYYGNVGGCLRLLGKIRSAKAVQFLRSRINLYHWDDKSVTVYDSKRSRLYLDAVRYRKLQRESAIHMLCLIPDATAELFINEYEVNNFDPDYRNLLNTINSHKFDLIKEKTLKKYTGELGARYMTIFDHLFKLKCGLRAYFLDHQEYPKNLTEMADQNYLDKIPNDNFQLNQLYSYQKNENGFKLWSVGPNGKTDEPGSSENDDIMIQYP